MDRIALTSYDYLKNIINDKRASRLHDKLINLWDWYKKKLAFTVKNGYRVQRISLVTLDLRKNYNDVSNSQLTMH